MSKLETQNLSSLLLRAMACLSLAAKIFVGMQLRGKRRMFTKKEQDFSISFYYKSPKAYRFLRRQGILLPSVSSIRGWIGQCIFKTGIDSSVLDQLQKKYSSMSTEERKCILAFDEMSIKKNLEYSKKLEIIEGYEDLGPLGRFPKLAKQVLVFSIRGLYHKWKLPIAYFVSGTSVTGDKMKSLILYVLDNLNSVGFLPKAIVCDQGPNNRKAYNNLGINSDNQFFFYKNNKIFGFYDVPHLFKNIRNNLLQDNFTLFGNIISFDYIKRVFDIDQSSNTARAMPKLSQKHINPNSFEKMSCKLALQVLSHTVAAAIRTCVENNQIDAAGIHTANFLEEMNHLFDCLNSKRLYSKNPYGSGLSEKNPLILETLKNGIYIYFKI